MGDVSRRAFLSAAAGAALALAGCAADAGLSDGGPGDAVDEAAGTGEGTASPDEVVARTSRETDYGRGFLTGLGPADELRGTVSGTPGAVEELSYTCHAYALEAAEGRDDLVVQKRLLVYVPRGYDPSRRWNVLYLLHGTGGSELYWLGDESMAPSASVGPSSPAAGNVASATSAGGEGDSSDGASDAPDGTATGATAEDIALLGAEAPYHGQETRNVLDYLFDQGLVQDTIVVAPTYYSVPEGWDTDTSAGGDDPYAWAWPEHFWRELADDIVPLVEGTYSTWAEGDLSAESLAASRDHRAFVGLSRGSHASVASVMMHRLDWFGYVGSLSGVWVDAGEFGSALDAGFPDLSLGYWYHGNGSGDFSLEDHRDFVRAVLEEMPGRFEDGRNLAWMCLPGGQHSFESWCCHLYNCMLAFFGA